MNSLSTAQKKSQTFQDYLSLFVQRIPRYIVKSRRTWRTKNKALCDLPVLAHLGKKYSVGVLGKWYPQFAILDLDSKSWDQVKDVRESLGLDSDNSRLFQTESRDSYHILVSPQYNGKPPTLKLLNTIFNNFAKAKGIEIYPQSNKAIRLPFGKFYRCLDPEYAHMNWKDHVYWFQKMNLFDLRTVNFQQYSFDFTPLEKPGIPQVLESGAELLEHGLQRPSSRHDSQMALVFFLWRNNIPQSQAEAMIWNWIREKHNGFSKDIVYRPRAVRSEISRQADWVYEKYAFNRTYPDETHNHYKGWITAEDIPDLIEATGGSKPKLRFTFEMIKHAYPRRHRKRIHIHSDKLMEWTGGHSQRYQKRLSELEEKGIIKSRTTGYVVGNLSKGIELDWPWRSSKDGVLYDGRSVESLSRTLKLTLKPSEFREILESKAKIPKRTMYWLIKEAYEKEDL